jgi:hypothetical protein
VKRTLGIVAAFAAIAAGCGSVENEPNLAKAVARTEAVGSSRFEVRADTMVAGERRAMRCDGAADYASKDFRLSCEGDEADLNIEMVVLRDTMYIRSPITGLQADKWLEFPASDADDDDFAQYFAPDKLLAMLRDASRDTGRVGDEDVRGVSTVRYKLTVDCEEAKLACDDTAPVEVWIDGDGLLRRIWVEDSGYGGTIDFFDFGVDVDIEPPPAERVADIGALGSGTVRGGGHACSGGEGTPITKTRAFETLREHGFTVRFGECVGGPEVVAAMSNEHDSEAVEREGLLWCHVYKTAGSASSTEGGGGGGGSALRVANLACTLLAEGVHQDGKADRLEKAFAELGSATGG